MTIQIKYALRAEHNADWYESKAQTEYAFWLIRSGRLIIEYKNETYSLSAGDIFFFYPKILYHASSNEDCTFTFIHFDAVLGADYRALHFYPFDGKYPADMVSGYFDSLLFGAASMQKDKLFADLEMQGAVMFFLANIMRIRYEKREEDKAVNQKNALARLQPVLIYINHHLAEPIYISDLAASVNLSEKYFIKFFKKTMGVTPGNYITKVKMKKALQYLHEQRYSVKEVAVLTGYADIYTFSKAFKKIYNAAPSKF